MTLRFEHSPISCSHFFDQLRVSGLVMLIAKEASQAKVLSTYKEHMNKSSVFYFRSLAQSIAAN